MAKQALVLNYLRSSLTVHSIKDLEKALPSVASINAMQVKDYLQALSDESQIRVEKIGSGNWYWSFVSEERQTRETSIAALEAGYHKIQASVQALQGEIDTAMANGQGEVDANLQNGYNELEAEVEILEKVLKGYKDADPIEVIKKKNEVELFKAKANRWTDNILCLEDYANELTGGDRSALESIRAQLYGDEYIEGEGLKDL